MALVDSCSYFLPALAYEMTLIFRKGSNERTRPSHEYSHGELG